ncbi:MAG: class I SAM-dependent DNA methyltransferase, partial [Bacteroidetes bacterium]|nr:class I SAM-dependent DNA methyltransferase [Bacteroidota bacterium]
MNKLEAKNLIVNTFEKPFNEGQFTYFVKNLLNNLDESKRKEYRGQYVPDAFSDAVKHYKRIGQYIDANNNVIDVLIVNLNRGTSLERARSLQRNFIARYLKQRTHDAALVAYYTDGSNDWRFSLVKMDINLIDKKIETDFTPARRYSFLVGTNEGSHTAQNQFVKVLIEKEVNPTLDKIEDAFNIETVTKEFFLKYRDLFIHIKQSLETVIKNDSTLETEFSTKEINSVDFSKKLLGQIVFLYFLQKKGWFGVEKNSKWGSGSKKFLREIFEKKHGSYDNFFNDILEPLFYEALRNDRTHEDHYYSRFNCKIPFLNGGLFDPIGNYDWVKTDIALPNELFSNSHQTKEGDTGDGILDVFDRYNFTVIEDEPLEKEVAIDPELLGKAYEKFNAIRLDNFDEYLKALKSGKKGDESKFNKQYGVFYTPREIVHYMCQQSLINYLATDLEGKASKESLEFLILEGEKFVEHLRTAKEKNEKDEDYKGKYKESNHFLELKENANQIDILLANVK